MHAVTACFSPPLTLHLHIGASWTVGVHVLSTSAQPRQTDQHFILSRASHLYIWENQVAKWILCWIVHISCTCVRTCVCTYKCTQSRIQTFHKTRPSNKTKLLTLSAPSSTRIPPTVANSWIGSASNTLHHELSACEDLNVASVACWLSQVARITGRLYTT